MLISLKCPNCNGDVQMDDAREFGFCMFCGTKLMNQKNEMNLRLDESNKLVNLLKNAKVQLQLCNYGTALTLADEALRIDADCQDALLVKAFNEADPRKRELLLDLSEHGKSYGVITKDDEDLFPGVWVIASEKLKKSVEIDIGGTSLHYEIMPGQRIKLPYLPGRPLVNFRLHGGGGGNRKFLDLTKKATVIINPTAGFMSSLLPIDIKE